MKKLVSNLVVAFFGGLTAFAGIYYFNVNKNINSSNQNFTPTTPIKMTSSKIEGINSTDFTFAADKSLQAVVHIKTISEQINNLSYDPFAELFFGHQRQQSFVQQGSGSGVIISADGYIVTNNHVVNGSNKIEVVLNDKRTYEAEIVGTDASTDLALIKINEKDLNFLTYGNSDIVKVGEWALAVGNPFNLNSTVTAGIISAKGRNNILNTNNKPIESFIQTDAVVNPGNSGGALVNTNGELIGINTAIASNNGAFQGYSFAVPVNIVKKVISDLIEFGTVQRAYIGVSIQDLDAKFAANKNIKVLNGVYVNGLTQGGSAQDAGVEEGDVITKIQDVPVTSVSELQEQISRYRPGDKVMVTVNRKNNESNIQVILKTLDNSTKLVKKSELISSNIKILGAEFSNLEESQLSSLNLSNGVKITKLNSGKLAQVGIQSGFVITNIDKKKMINIQDVKQILENKTGIVLIEGVYPNGMRASYSFPL
jgi:Do/DeqQ family serine protease